MTVIQILAGGAVTIIVAAGGWFVTIVAKRGDSQVQMALKSGTIHTTEAGTLWHEQEKLREYLTERLEDRDAEVAALGLEVRDCNRLCEELREETFECKRRERVLTDKLDDALRRLKKVEEG